MPNSAALQLKLVGSEPRLLFRLKPPIGQTYLRLTPEAIDKNQKLKAIHKKMTP